MNEKQEQEQAALEAAIKEATEETAAKAEAEEAKIAIKANMDAPPFLIDKILAAVETQMADLGPVPHPAEEVEEPEIKAFGYNQKKSAQAIFSDPMEGWLAATQSTELLEEAIEIPSLVADLKHQTLVLIEASQGSPVGFKERMIRFVSGLNTETTMKATVVTVADGKIYAGLTLAGKQSGGLDVPIVPGRWNAVIRIKDKDVI